MAVKTNLSVRPEDMFKLMRSAYKSGVLPKMLAIQREALAASGQDIDFEAKLDVADPSKAENVMRWGGPIIRFLSNPMLLAFLGHLLDIPQVRRRMVDKARRGLSQAPPVHDS